MSRAADRQSWAVGLLALRPDSAVLEVGCGRGLAAALVCDRLTSGRYVGLDRSATALEHASARAGEAVRRGTASFVRAALADWPGGGPGGSPVGRPGAGFDRVLAVDVNLFWTGSATAELAVLRRVLAPGGRLVVAYGLMSDADPRIDGPVQEHLAAAGFEVTTTREGRLLGVVGTLSPRAVTRRAPGRSG